MIVIHRNYLIFWIFINAIAELVADLVVRSFFDDEERRSFLGRRRGDFEEEGRF
ncbi:hypothetical protein O53_3899 [Microcystis aeruginosa TAIHU98]|uniref:Uncharacterized protein n=1 Tax=Microcystis aeruginosa TAIHU98 TaxID=1134457 RepID=L7E8B1_MICAE|nr:hypothetical protein O53_3899 [Microcystis aeruginosa TAIHU98]ODV39749.1 hypothetical protein BFG60_0780 [Microcystis aeruginosa NIES-98]